MADNSLTSHTFVPKFDGFYDHWAMLMENLLQSKEIWSSIDPRVTVAPENATAEQLEEARVSRLQDLKVKSYLFQAIDRTILETILTRNTSKKICIEARKVIHISDNMTSAIDKQFHIALSHHRHSSIIP
jgi:hypothetical protein